MDATDRMRARRNTVRETVDISAAPGWIPTFQKATNCELYDGCSDKPIKIAQIAAGIAAMMSARRRMRRSPPIARSNATAEKNISGTRPRIRNFSGYRKEEKSLNA